MCKAFFRALLLGLLLLAIRSAQAAQLYWNDGNLIHRAALDGSGPQNLDPTYNALGIAANPADGLFWTDDVPRVPIGPTGTIRHADLNGMGMTDVLPGIPTPIGIALDAAHGKMYWTDSANVIHRANLDGTNAENLINQPSIADLSGIVVDAAHNRFYFSFVNPLVDNARPGGIGSANLDGSDFQIAVGSLVNPQGLGLDPSGNLYWADVDRIQRAPIGGTAQDLVTGLSRPFGLALDVADQTVFWTDSQAGLIERAPLTGGKATPVVTNLSNPTAIAILVAASSWTGSNGTAWGDSGNWSGPVPGATAGTTNTDTALFNRNAPNSPLTIEPGRNVQNITFDTASVNSLAVGTVDGPALLLTAGGAIQTTSTVASPQTVNAPLVLEGNYTFTSAAQNSSATLSFGGGITPVATGVTMLTLNGGNAGANTINGVLADQSSGLLAVAKSGSGVWVLSGANTYGAGTTISAGTLQLSGSGTLGNVNGSLNVTGGTLDLNKTAQGVGQLTSTGAGGAILNNGTGTSTLIVGNGDATGGNFNGVIADHNNAGGGVVALTKTGFGTITLSGANTYTGPTNVNTGTLAVAAPGGFGNTAITVAATASFSARAGSGTLSIGSTSNPSAGATITLNLGAGAVNGGTFDMLDGAIGTVMLNQGANVATGMTLGTSGPFNSPVLAFEIGDNGTTTTADHLFVTNGVVVGIGTGAAISITPIGSNPLHVGTYPLITAGSFTNADRFSLAKPAISIGSNQYNLSLANTGTVENLTVSLGGPPVAYWSGKQNSVWNALTPAPGGTNWLNAPAGTDAGALPSSGTNVFFTANSAANLATTLGTDFTINSLTFTGTGTSAIKGVKISGNTLTINASAASANPEGSGIVVQAGSGAHTIASSIVLAASQTWTNNSTNPLTLSGNIGDAGRNLSLTITGPGPIILSGESTYGGHTTVTDGALATTSTGTIGAGPLTVSSTGTPSVVNLGSIQSIGTLSGMVSGGSSARVNVGVGVTLTVTQSADATFAGAVNLGSTTNLTKLGGNRLEIDGGTSLGDTSLISVIEGTLRLAPTTGSPSVSTGVIASITGGATLELGGSVSSLGTKIADNRANIQNNSAAAAGLLISGTNQQVGGIDGSGTTQVNAGSDLTADHIIQNALLIGGAAGSPALVTIDASDASGNPLGQAATDSSGSIFASLLASGGPFSAGIGSASPLSAPPNRPSSSTPLSLGGSVSTVSVVAVPEPSTILITACATLSLLGFGIGRRQKHVELW